MENRYLYRGKQIDNKEWVIGFLSFHKNGKVFIRSLSGNATSSTEVIPESICQCTGLKDKNGKRIWENDIVNCLSEECFGYIGWNESEAGFYFNVLFEDGGFEEEHIYDYQDCLEVIGNIFDSQELLEV